MIVVDVFRLKLGASIMLALHPYRRVVESTAAASAARS
jgi:hypothetical protein